MRDIFVINAAQNGVSTQILPRILPHIDYRPKYWIHKLLIWWISTYAYVRANAFINALRIIHHPFIRADREAWWCNYRAMKVYIENQRIQRRFQSVYIHSTHISRENTINCRTREFAWDQSRSIRVEDPSWTHPKQKPLKSGTDDRIADINREMKDAIIPINNLVGKR